MLSKHFLTATKKITAHAQNFSTTLYVFENKRNEDGLSELKILVSVVRFRPGPPRISIAHSLGYFLMGLLVSDYEKTNYFFGLGYAFN